MSGESLEISTLHSFMRLTDDDKRNCMESYLSEPLQQKHIQNKYIKRTETVNTRVILDNDCFLCFDIFPLTFKYSAIVFSICGISHHFHHVIYMTCIEDSKLESMDQFVCDVLTNILIAEVPKLTSFTIKFVLCRDNPLNVKVHEIFSKSTKTIKLFNTFPFIREPSGYRNTELLDPYAQFAWLEITQGNIEQNNVREIFRKHRGLAEQKENAELKRFVTEFFTVARDLLDTKYQINLRLCNIERMDIFQKIVTAHLKNYNEQNATRLFLFELMRAIVHIYGY